MPDNVESASGSGGPTFASDEIANIHYPRVKLVLGANNSNDGDVASGNPMPVTGTVTANLGATDNAVLDSIDAAVNGTLAVSNAGTFATQVDGAALTALQLIDDAVHADDAAFTLGTSKGVMIMGFAGTQSVNANDAAALACDTDGALHVSDGGNSLTVDGTVDLGTANVTNAGTFAVQESGTALTRLTDIETNTNYGAVTGGGVEASALRVTLASDSTGVVSVDDNGGALTVDNGGTFAVQVDAALPAGTNTIGKLAANSGVDIGDTDVISVIPGTGATNLGKAEDAAHTTGDTGVMALAVRNDDLAALAGTDGDYAPLQVSQNGALLTCPAANDDYKYAVIDAATSGDNTLVAAAGAGVKVRVLAGFLISAGTVNARFESGASGTALTGQMNLVANSGFTLPYNPAGWFETAANTLLNLELSAAVSVDGCLTYVEVA